MKFIAGNIYKLDYKLDSSGFAKKTIRHKHNFSFLFSKKTNHDSGKLNTRMVSVKWVMIFSTQSLVTHTEGAVPTI